MTGLNIHIVYLYHRWVLCVGNGALICPSRQPLGVFAPYFLHDIYLLQGFQNTKKHSVWCAGWTIQHMAAQKVRFTSRLLRQVALAGTFQAQLHLLHIRAELETYHFWPQCPPPLNFLVRKRRLETQSLTFAVLSA